jgi:transposase
MWRADHRCRSMVPVQQDLLRMRHHHQPLTLAFAEWTCGDCGTYQHRDFNAGRNLRRLAVSSTAFVGGEQGSPRYLGARKPFYDAEPNVA